MVLCHASCFRGKKTGFIDGSCRRSNTDSVLGRQWDIVNAIVLGWILNSISEELFLGQFFSKSAKHVWHELKETYDKVKSLWKQFDALVQLPRYELPDVRPISNSRPFNVTRPVNNGNRRPNGGSPLVCENCRRFISNNNSTSSSSTFSDEQISKLLSLIKENSLGDKGKWVQANMAGIKVSHPSKTEALITKVGNLNLTKFSTLYDVLVVPELTVTLVSVHKVARDTKQTREPFPLSEHKSSVLGELVHLDLWGPYRVVSKEGYKYFLTIVDDFTRAVWDLDHVNFFNEVVHEGPDISYDDNGSTASDHCDGSYSS
ncbi:ribonuclease H-like domain-containing protein [Tanacetum coccineum]